MFRAHMIGAGAMGSLFGFLLAEAGCAVTLVDPSPERLKSLERNGLVLEENGRERPCRPSAPYGNGPAIRAVPTAEQAGPADAVFLSVKAGRTGAAARAARACLEPHTLVLSLQNGLGNIEAMREAGLGVFAAGTTACGASLTDSGTVRPAGRGETVLGWVDGPPSPALQGTLERLLFFFDAASLPWRVSENIQGVIWTKLLVNAGINAVTALTGVPNGVMATDPDARALLEAAVREGAALAGAEGVALETDDPVGHALAVARGTAANRSSMLQDMDAGRLTEIEAINGAIAARAARRGLAAPVNAALASLVRMAERRAASGKTALPGA